jgi:putative endonuclease
VDTRSKDERKDDGQSNAVTRRQAVGRHGEDVAARHVTALGWTVLDRNWRGTRGELDIVARDGDEVVAIEVKTRTTTACGHPALAVGPAKLGRIGRLAGQWLSEHAVQARSVRIDVIAVLLPRTGAARVEHLRGVQP